MAFTIDGPGSIKGQINKRNGVLRTNRFLFRTTTPPVLLNNYTNGFSNSVEYYCQSINFPGYQIAMGDVRRWTYGPNEKRPFGPNFQQLQMNFISDGNNDMWKFFTEWMSFIIPHQRNAINGSGGMIQSTASYPGLSPYELSYKSEYAVDVELHIFDERGIRRQKIICYEAFPSNILDVPLNWGDTNSTLNFTVTLEYLDWDYELRDTNPSFT